MSGRRVNGVLGVVVSAALLAGCGTTPPTPPVTASATPASTPTVAASGPDWTSLNCGRLDHDPCLRSVRLVEQTAPTLFGPTTAVIADYLCGPGERCEAGFNALVGLIQSSHPDKVLLSLVKGTPDHFVEPAAVFDYPYALPDFMKSLLPA